jgi:hypothetical protein
VVEGTFGSRIEQFFANSEVHDGSLRVMTIVESTNVECSTLRRIPDNEILLLMGKFGFNSSQLTKELYQDIETDGTLVYSIMKRAALAERMEGIGTGPIKIMLDRIPAVLNTSRGQTTKRTEVWPTTVVGKMGTCKEPRSLHACFRAGQRAFCKSRKA